MQQFSFNPAPFNQFNKYLIYIYILSKKKCHLLSYKLELMEICLRVNDTFFKNLNITFILDHTKL